MSVLRERHLPYEQAPEGPNGRKRCLYLRNSNAKWSQLRRRLRTVAPDDGEHKQDFKLANVC